MVDGPNENYAAYLEALDAVRAHPMCAKFEDDGATFTVLYPAGDFHVDGTRVCYTKGKRWALEQMLVRMERHWVDSYPAGVAP